MTTLKCAKCNSEFNDKDFINTSKVSGMNGVSVGKWKTVPIWPFQTSIVSVCPQCGKNTKLLVIVSKETKTITVLIIVVIIVLLVFAFISH